MDHATRHPGAFDERISEIESSISPRFCAIAEFRRSWRVLCAAFLGMLFCFLPGSVVGVFINPWADTFGWSLSATGYFYSFLGLGSAIAGPMIGRLIDRYGARRVTLICIPTLSLSVAVTSRIGADIWTLYSVMFVWGSIIPGFTAYARAINGWFDAGRGTALGLMSVGFALGTAIGPRLIQAVVDDYGWQTGCLVLSTAVLLVWPFVFCWLYEKRDTGAPSKTTSFEVGYARKEAVKTSVFWLLGSSFLLWGLTAGGTLFLIPFLTMHDVSRDDAALCVSMLGVFTTVGLPIIGIIIDRVHAPYVAAVALLVSASAFAVLGVFDGEYALLAVPMIGITISAWMCCLDYSTARYFGLKSFSEISGFINCMASIGAILGPIVFGLLKETTQGYKAPYVAMAALAVGSAVCMAIAGRQPFRFRSTPNAIAAPALGPC